MCWGCLFATSDRISGVCDFQINHTNLEVSISRAGGYPSTARVDQKLDDQIRIWYLILDGVKMKKKHVHSTVV